MRIVSKMALIVALLGFSSQAIAGGFAVIGGRLTEVYMNSTGGTVKIGFQGAVSNPVGCTHAPCVVFVPDYSTASRIEATKSIISGLMAAYLSGKNVDIYAQGCTADPWGTPGQTVPALYDLSIHNW